MLLQYWCYNPVQCVQFSITREGDQHIDHVMHVQHSYQTFSDVYTQRNGMKILLYVNMPTMKESDVLSISVGTCTCICEGDIKGKLL